MPISLGMRRVVSYLRSRVFLDLFDILILISLDFLLGSWVSLLLFNILGVVIGFMAVFGFSQLRDLSSMTTNTPSHASGAVDRRKICYLTLL